ncbi:hypothetical protein [Falsibacillus pallidus]|uniref:hypothetical protein n=1 Tax=Falsibacillus pallidus TaxID=493781 RepID=UPI003D992BFA
MNLLVSIIFSTILGCILLLVSPVYGGLIAFGIVAGCLFRGLFLLNEINKKLTKSSRKTDYVYASLKSKREENEDDSKGNYVNFEG